MNRDTALSILDAFKNKTLLTSKITGLSPDHKIARVIVAANEVVATGQSFFSTGRMRPNQGVSQAFFKLLIDQFPLNIADIETVTTFWSDHTPSLSKDYALHNWKSLRDTSILNDDLDLTMFVNMIAPIFIVRALINEGITLDYQDVDGIVLFAEHYRQLVYATDKNNLGIWWW